MAQIKGIKNPREYRNNSYIALYSGNESHRTNLETNKVYGI